MTEVQLIASPARAAELAREGRYEEALRLLHALGGRDSTDPQVLDLLARIHAQRGELLDADECWALAQRLDADLTSAREGRRRIAAIQARRLRPRAGRVVLVVVIAGVVVAGAGIAGALVTRQDSVSDPAVVAGLTNAKTAQDELARRVDALGGRLDETAMRHQRILTDLTSSMAGTPALTTHLEAGGVVVTFPIGVFGTAAQLSDKGRASLAEAAQRLRGFGATMSVTVVGHTENAPVARNGRYDDNADLGLARARIAAEQMSTASGLPLSAFALASAGTANPPYPNTTVEGQLKNRTVTLVLKPA